MGTTIRQQFNPSTLKASYNPETKKAQVLKMVCEWCDDGRMPAWIDVTMSELVDYPDCCGPGVYSDRAVTGSCASVCNGTRRVPYNSECLYSKSFSVSGPQIEIYNSTNETCVGLYSQLDFVTLTILVYLLETGVTIKYRLRQSPHMYEIWPFIGTITYTGEDECGNTNNTAENDLVICAASGYGPMIPCPSTGTVSIAIP